MGMAAGQEGKAVTTEFDAIRTAMDLVEEHGRQGAEEIAVEQKSIMEQEGRLFELSVWREIHNAIREAPAESLPVSDD